MNFDLVKFFNQLPDFRRKQGLRYPLGVTLSMVIMAILSQKNSTRGFASFMDGNVEELSVHFNLPHGVPSHVTLGTILQNISLPLLTHNFRQWMSEYVDLSEEEFVSGDGKALASTVTDYDKNLQAFVMIVTLFSQKTGLALHLKAFNNGKSGEAEHIRNLIQTLNLQGLTFDLDALHCQKKL